MPRSQEGSLLPGREASDGAISGPKPGKCIAQSFREGPYGQASSKGPRNVARSLGFSIWDGVGQRARARPGANAVLF